MSLLLAAAPGKVEGLIVARPPLLSCRASVETSLIFSEVKLEMESLASPTVLAALQPRLPLGMTGRMMHLATSPATIPSRCATVTNHDQLA